MVTGIMVDFSKAFDFQGHELILCKLKKLGIMGRLKNGLRVTCRVDAIRISRVENQNTLKVFSQTTRSNPLRINGGLTQGTVPVPDLFMLLTNDMLQYLSKHCT